MNNILAKIEAKNSECMESVLLNLDGYVAECTADNIFIVKDGILKTPAAYLGALEGITRNAVLEIAGNLKIASQEAVLTRFDLYNADECFLTGSGAEIVPVVRVDQAAIGSEKPGPITKHLITEFKKAVNA
jgi:branched-chain amino acid aminotransferase